jgi:choline dehydrogenase
LFEKSDNGLVATGVEFNVKGKLYKATASREVILAAGAIHTPQLLELSGMIIPLQTSTRDDQFSIGIGNPSVLQAQDIPVLLDLPAVGENLQVRSIRLR